MADPIRLQILNALVSQMETITVANGYRNDIVTADVYAKGCDHPDVRPGTMPWIGIVPQKEIIREVPQTNISDWPFQIIAHFQFTTRTDIGLATACANMTSDVRRALYDEPQLDVEGVHLVKMTGRYGSEGSDEAVREGMGSIMVECTVRFRESVSAQ